MNKPNAASNNITEGLIIMVLLNWFNKSFFIFKFKYDVTNTNWVDIDEPLYYCHHEL
jgi:hypothetical protein